LSHELLEQTEAVISTALKDDQQNKSHWVNASILFLQAKASYMMADNAATTAVQPESATRRGRKPSEPKTDVSGPSVVDQERERIKNSEAQDKVYADKFDEAGKIKEPLGFNPMQPTRETLTKEVNDFLLSLDDTVVRDWRVHQADHYEGKKLGEMPYDMVVKFHNDVIEAKRKMIDQPGFAGYPPTKTVLSEVKSAFGEGILSGESNKEWEDRERLKLKRARCCLERRAMVTELRRMFDEQCEKQFDIKTVDEFDNFDEPQCDMYIGWLDKNHASGVLPNITGLDDLIRRFLDPFDDDKTGVPAAPVSEQAATF
jgi:hypothetical protein